MLDYSDEELEPQSVQKRSRLPLSPRNADSTVLLGPREFLPGADEPQMGFVGTTQSIFRGFKEKSSGLIVSDPNPPSPDAFVISDFIPGKRLQSTPQFHNLNSDLKGDRFFSNSDALSVESKAHPDSFYKSMSLVVFLSQFFGVFPISGISGPNFKSLTFTWIHYKTGYLCLTFLGNVFCFICSTTQGLDVGAFQAASGILYFACGTFSSLLLLNLSRNWKKLNKEFAEIEIKFEKYGYPPRIAFKFKVFIISVLLAALVEHVLAKLRSVLLVVECSKGKYEFSDFAKAFFFNEYPEVFAIFSYAFWKGLLVLIVHFLTTANWNFKDLFLCMISWTISERFKQINDLLGKVQGQDRPVSFWKEVREDYNHLSVLTKRIDAHIRKLMFLSIGQNLFFICIQLFNSLKRKISSFWLIYFFWSFGFLVLRTAFVAFSAARINDESKEPKAILYSVPQRNYTAEVRRFLTQLTTNEVALTGSGFFSITRSLILTITGSVITYEIVLVQFGSKEIEDDFIANSTTCVSE